MADLESLGKAFNAGYAEVVKRRQAWDPFVKNVLLPVLEECRDELNKLLSEFRKIEVDESSKEENFGSVQFAFQKAPSGIGSTVELGAGLQWSQLDNGSVIAVAHPFAFENVREVVNAKEQYYFWGCYPSPDDIDANEIRITIMSFLNWSMPTTLFLLPGMRKVKTQNEWRLIGENGLVEPQKSVWRVWLNKISKCLGDIAKDVIVGIVVAIIVLIISAILIDPNIIPWFKGLLGIVP
mgnify:CR=1 FL=1